MDGKKVKIVRIINRFNIGGPTFNATFLTRFMSEEFETVLVGGVPDEGEKDSLHILKQYGVEPIVIPELQRNPNIRSDWRAYRKLKAIIKEAQPDIVHTHASKAGFLGRIAARSCGVKVIVHTFHGHVFHSYFGKLKTFAVKSMERSLARISTGIIAISDLQKKDLVDKYKICSSNKVTVIPLGFDLEKFEKDIALNRKNTREKWEISDEEVAIAIVGRLAPIKDHSFFLAVVERLLKTTNQKIKVFIVGDGSEWVQVKSKVDKLNHRYHNKIIMTSWILDISRFNHGMDVICLTSKNEGTPVSLIEAQAAGLPVVSSDVGGVRDIIQENISGYIIKPDDIETYTEKLRLLVENKNIRNNFAEKGVAFIKEKYHYRRLVCDMESYYKKLLGKT